MDTYIKQTDSPNQLLPDKLLKVDDLTKILGMGKSSIYAMAKSGELPSIRIGRSVRFLASDIQKFIEDRRQCNEHNADIKSSHLHNRI